MSKFLHLTSVRCLISSLSFWTLKSYMCELL